MSAVSNGGAAKRVRVIDASDLKANGGSYALSGQPPVRVYGVTDAETKAQGGPYAVEGNIAMPVYVVGTAEPVEGTVAPVPMIGVDSLAAGNVAIPVFVVGGSLGGGAPDAPANLTAVPTGADNLHVLLTWDASADATGYIVEYDDGGGWVEIDDTALLTFTHTTPTLGIDTHSYRVRAYNGDGESANATVDIVDGLLGLVAAWLATRASGNWIDGVGGIVGVQQGTVSAVAGLFGNAARLEAANLEGFDIAAPPAALNFAGVDYSIVATIKAGGAGTNRNIFGSHHDGAAGDFYIDVAERLSHWVGSAKTATATVTAGVWMLAGLVVDTGVDIKFYTNTTEDVTTYGALTGAPTDANIGISNSQTLPFEGDINQVLIYKRALSAGNIAWMHNGGAGRDMSIYL